MMKVITIGRQFGSGGRRLGKELAKKLGFAYYDREIITEIAKQTDLAEDYVEQLLDQKPTAFYPVSSGSTFHMAFDPHFNLSNTVFFAQSRVIREIAARENCVIVGRCADYILREQHPLRIFVYAPMERRVERCMANLRPDEQGITEKEMEKRILKEDKARRKYYRFFTGQAWGDINCYDLCLNTAVGTVDNWVEFLQKAIESQ
ncbi:MAG: cytidylate kinase-like family protein [Clostridia bacterium]|nr:cytidylate kinase-like family protein [Clostridia bacterium]